MDEKIEFKPFLEQPQALHAEKRYKKPSGLRKQLGLLLLMAMTAFSLFSTWSCGQTQSTKVDKNVVVGAYLKAMETNNIEEWLKKYTSTPQTAGTNFPMVQWCRDKLEQYGFEATIDEYEIYMSYPNSSALSLLTNDSVVYEAPLVEDVLEDDPDTSGDDLVPTYLGYGGNGNVTADYIYCNYGSMADFAKLEKLGVSVKGKIAIMRYGGIFRGLKVKFAQDRGAVGAILYSDPGDDFGITPANGYKTYPDGPARNPSAVQRGSVQFLSFLPGDPTTPGYASKPGVPRSDPFYSTPRIPVLPLSYRDVTPILEKLNGYGPNVDEVIPAEEDTSSDKFTGELPGYDYSIGPNPEATLNLYSNQIFNITPLWNIYGEILGENQDEVIIIGNHHDSWIKGGAGDPHSGSAVLLELARGLDEVIRTTGWKPKRTIMLASWDGEEMGLLGSTEFGEYLADKLQRKVIAYFNLDVATIGPNLEASASPLLHELFRSTLAKLEYPKGGSLYEHFKAFTGDRITNLGSGSDYTVFQEHLGIPSIDMGFISAKGDPIYQYHSNYDSYHWMEKFADPGFTYHNLMSKLLGLLVIEISESDMIKFKLEDYSSSLEEYYEDAISGIPSKWLEQEVSLMNMHVINGLFANRVSSGEFTIPRYLQTCPQMAEFGSVPTSHHHKNTTFGDLLGSASNSLKQLSNTTLLFDDKVLLVQDQLNHWDELSLIQKIKVHFTAKKYNAKLKYIERAFLHYDGLDERSWFRHIVFAAGRYTGYAGQTFPGLREAIEDDDFDRAVKWLYIISQTAKKVNFNLSV
ncbi:unnamed protein product [Kuraishia capsulata CBS 1993]|uniref:FXNA-related family protease 1 n=1 Tax=Kuraishia capsulata CBS 1993 TaxID=1382522 RepID=W6MW95_9ASCO|nr:uncharacterized protein KUCA_T00003032001 [Kuraishia capsulata CBS 1993]CDK27055.1 unnamed protein product [Kuraishia capsulata CBS 1993]